MTRLVFLVEERSIAEVLNALLPRLLPVGVAHQVVPHEGKSDLEKSIPRKLRGWKEPGVRFVVIRDNDGGDCIALKNRLSTLCAESGRGDTLVRIVCQELEAWYLGDLRAVDLAYRTSTLARQQGTKRFRNPDALSSPSQVIQKLVTGHQQIAGARAIAPHLNIETNRSRSFHAFIEGVRRLTREGSPS